MGCKTSGTSTKCESLSSSGLVTVILVPRIFLSKSSSPESIADDCSSTSLDKSSETEFSSLLLDSDNILIF